MHKSVILPPGFEMKNSWFILLLFCFFTLFLTARQKQKQECAKLDNTLKNLQEKKAKIIEKHTVLLLQINSQNDPRWTELMLMKELGLVPEGQVKIYFPP